MSVCSVVEGSYTLPRSGGRMSIKKVVEGTLGDLDECILSLDRESEHKMWFRVAIDLDGEEANRKLTEFVRELSKGCETLDLTTEVRWVK